MAKHPVPKQKTSQVRTKQRYGKFVQEKRAQILKKINITDCPNCGTTKRNHHVCEECGQYKGRQVIEMGRKIDKITKVKA